MQELGMHVTAGAGQRGRAVPRARTRACWGCALTLGLSFAHGIPLHAQLLTAEQGITFAGATSGASCAALPTIDARTELAGPYARLAAMGYAGMHERERPRAVGALEASISAPEWRGWRLSADAVISSTDAVACDPHGRRREAGVAASFGGGDRGFWLGYRWRTAPTAVHPPAPDGLIAGVWQSLGAVTLGLSLGTQPDTGSRTSYESRQELREVPFWNDTLQVWETIPRMVTVVDTSVRSWRRSVVESRARVAWSQDRWSAGGALGAIWRPAGVGAEVWGALEGAVALTPRVALTGTYVATPRNGLVVFPGQHLATLGVRVLSAPVRGAPPVPGRALPRAFETRSRTGDDVVLALRAPEARYVEITGDFARWQARRMIPRPDGWWELPVRLSPGRYHVNVRVDGTRWTAPPGLPVAQDEFGGTVGVLVLR
jgi:hypothetical protein